MPRKFQHFNFLVSRLSLSLINHVSRILIFLPITYYIWITSPSVHSWQSNLIYFIFLDIGASLVAQTVKHLSAMLGTRVRSLGWEDALEKEMATHSSTLAWKIPWTEEPGRLQSVWLQRVRHD